MIYNPSLPPFSWNFCELFIIVPTFHQSFKGIPCYPGTPRGPRGKWPVASAAPSTELPRCNDQKHCLHNGRSTGAALGADGAAKHPSEGEKWGISILFLLMLDFQDHWTFINTYQNCCFIFGRFNGWYPSGCEDLWSGWWIKHWVCVASSCLIISFPMKFYVLSIWSSHLHKSALDTARPTHP